MCDFFFGGGSHLFDGCDYDHKEQRQAARDRTGGRVDDQLSTKTNSDQQGHVWK